MSLPARKQPGARARRRDRMRLAQVKRRLTGLRPWTGPGSGKTILQDVQRMIAALERDKEQ